MVINEDWDLIEKISENDTRYKANAYLFVIVAIERTISELSSIRHISGQELLEGITEYAMEQFGPMSKEVFNFWGIMESADFGNIVFNLIDAGLLTKTAEDSIEDFKNIVDFKRVFEDEYFKR
ncbi:hypothetical protein J7M07_03245 [bacterium]|nr:hypothetical protein [bacterium]